MAGMFGHSWVSAYGASPSGIGADTWAAALADVSAGQIASALRETLALGSDFPPSAPRFRAMCFGVPSLAYVRNCMDAEKIDRFVMLVRTFIFNYTYVRADQKLAERMLKEAYELARDHVMRGGKLPGLPVAAIEPPKEKPKVPASAETVRKYCADLEKLFWENP